MLIYSFYRVRNGPNSKHLLSNTDERQKCGELLLKKLKVMVMVALTFFEMFVL